MEENEKLPDFIKDQVVNHQNRIEKQKEFENDLRTNPRYTSFYNRFRADTIEKFITDYAKDKSMWLEHGSWRLERDENYRMSYYSMAENGLWEIQQKKLFNLQCQWRAELIMIKEVEICYDFHYWEHHIQNCPFLEHVTEEEVQLYCDYYRSNNFQFAGYTEWQDYENIKEEYATVTDSCFTPAWYEFYDSRRGTGTLLTLPDIRGEKEEFYCDIYFSDSRKIHEEREKNKTPEEKKPWLWAHGETLEEFMTKFEPAHLVNCYHAYRGEAGQKFLHDDSELNSAVETLLNADRKVIMEFNADWREAIICSANKYEAEIMSELLPSVYQEYLQRLSIGILPKDAEPDPNPSKDGTRMNWIRNIIEGRKMNGEPADLNF